MKIMIVDDEALIREHLGGLEEWAGLQCTIVGEASNGREALELIPVAKPQLVITDIRMPIMDGIELAENIRRSYPNIHVMFISAYHDFEYAKQAMKLGVCDFITKPIQVPEMLDSVELLQQGVLRMNEDERVGQEKIISMLLSEEKDTEDPNLQLQSYQVDHLGTQVMLVEIDNADLMHLSEKPLSLIVLREILDHRLKDQPYQYWTYLDRSGIYIILFDAEDLGPELGTESINIAKLLLASMHELAGHSLSIGISKPLPSILQLREGFRQSKQCMEYRMLLGKGSIISYDVLENLEKGRVHKEEKILNELMIHVRRGDSEQISACLRTVYRDMLAAGLNKNVIQQYATEILSRADRMRDELHIPVPDETRIETQRKVFGYSILSDLLQFLSRYLQDLAEEIARHANTGTPSIIKRVKDFLDKHCTEDVTLVSLSGHLHINHSYLSRLIKKETGVNFRDLLCQYRIEKAKEMMKQAEIKTFEIAYEVGFKDPSHFSQAFKRTVGVSPSEYRDSITPS
ncbi:response regulator transcription factor [Cohnella silvisoli]|uniref:Response regulator n=1 Tax=Cohnella silvisoli TaxID=2873699 RepID=A0ABV1L0S8_9BACL|nr:response regulator [Cohnella silvisoli]MCD9025372.1 response regulator [Cohnella silvisoli]